MNRPPGKLCFIDHVVGNQPEDAMVPIAEWYVHITIFKDEATSAFAGFHVCPVYCSVGM